MPTNSWETFYARTLSHLSTKSNPPENSDNNKDTNDDNNSGNDTDDGEDDDSDPGTSWFTEHNAPQKVLDYLTSDDFPLSPQNTLSPEHNANGEGAGKGKAVLPDQPKILDLGTGNGSMLALLRTRGGFRGEMVGVDYSRGSVELARELQRGRGHSAYLPEDDDEDGDQGEEGNDEGPDGGVGGGDDDDEGTQIRFEEWDILNASGNGSDWFPRAQGGFDIVLDKGTFDAVSLSEDVDVDAGADQRVCVRYPVIARGLVRKGGYLVVTSCNWTEEELVRWFTSGTGEDRLVVWGRVEYPVFRFGGKEGQGVCTVCFQRTG